MSPLSSMWAENGSYFQCSCGDTDPNPIQTQNGFLHHSPYSDHSTVITWGQGQVRHPDNLTLLLPAGNIKPTHSPSYTGGRKLQWHWLPKPSSASPTSLTTVHCSIQHHLPTPHTQCTSTVQLTGNTGTTSMCELSITLRQFGFVPFHVSTTTG